MPQGRARRCAATDAKPESADTWYVGVDEAGYGPNLGPLVVAATAFRGPHSLATSDWWKVLSPWFGRNGSRAPLIIDDSKVVFSGLNGRDRLDASASTFLALAGIASANLTEVVLSIAKPDLDALRAEHWFPSDADAIREPSDGDRRSPPIADLAPFVERLERAGVSVAPPFARLLFPLAFNEQLEKANKAQIELALVHDLLKRQLAAVDPKCERIVILVDRLGGRRYYRSFVEELAEDAFVCTVAEEPTRSAYRYDWSGRDVEIHFCVNGDHLHLPVAASSILAKFVRERCMDGLNSFWASRSPGLAPTSGYPTDASRFRREIEPLLSSIPLPLAAIWRAK